MSDANVKEVVREKYAEAARRVASEGRTSCCGPAEAETSCCGGGISSSAPDLRDPVTRDLYADAEKEELPADALAASLGCGNPTALAELSPGEDVLDLGSGGGIDVLLSARRVAPGGTAYGLDMTDEMLLLARRNQREAGVTNARFLKGEIESVPLPDSAVDVVISNCVINLSVDKGAVLREAFRVLRPGGRFAVSDIVLRGELPAPIRKSLEMWAGCVAGALQESEYRRLLQEAGFEDVDIEPTRVYTAEDSRDFLGDPARFVTGIGHDVFRGFPCGIVHRCAKYVPFGQPGLFRLPGQILQLVHAIPDRFADVAFDLGLFQGLPVVFDRQIRLSGCQEHVGQSAVPVIGQQIAARLWCAGGRISCGGECLFVVPALQPRVGGLLVMPRRQLGV